MLEAIILAIKSPGRIHLREAYGIELIATDHW